jgi:glycosyltransferase involved in cell wall biosynthesis
MLPEAIYTGYLTDDALATAFASSDIFFNPSASETFGCVTVESLASGLAVVAADAPGSRDIIRNGIDGIVCPPEDCSAFAAALKQLIQSPSAREALRKSGVQRAANYRWDVVLDAMVKNYEEVAASSPRR